MKKLKVKFINWLFKDILYVAPNATYISSDYIFCAGRIEAHTVSAMCDIEIYENTTAEAGAYIENMLQQNDLIYQKNK